MSSKTTTTFLEIKVGTSFVKIDAETAHRYVQGSIGWQDVVASELYLNPDSKNQYLVDELAVLLDSPAISINKTTVDALGLTDAQTVELQKAINDTFSVADEVALNVAFRREPTDSFDVADITVFTYSKNVSDSFGLADVDGYAFTKPASDSVSFGDADAVLMTKNPADSVSLGDNSGFGLSRAIEHAFGLTEEHGFSFVKYVADAFALDDSATVDAIKKSTAATKTNIFSLGDEQTFTFSKTAADSFSLADDFSYTLISLNTSVLNASALNEFTFN